jgi:type I restriction enzyme S subunit
VRIGFPDLRVQQSVGEFLGALDGLIENNRRRAQVLEEMARTIYREWFVKFRYPGHESVPLVDSVLGPIPKGWAVSRLAAVASITMGQSPKSEHYNHRGIGKPFHQGVADFGSHFPTTRKWCSVDGRSAFAGDILVSVRAPVGRINMADTDMTIGRGLAAVRARDGRQALLLGRLRELFAEEDSIGNDGAIFKTLGRSEFASLPVINAPEGLSQTANEVLSDNLSMIEALTLSERRLSRMRDLLLPKLVSGQIDMASLNLDRVLEEAIE